MLAYYFVSSNNEVKAGSFVPYLKLSYTKGKESDLDFTYKGIHLGMLRMISNHIGLNIGATYSFDKRDNYSYYYDPYYGSYPGGIQERNGNRFMIGLGIESFIF